MWSSVLATSYVVIVFPFATEEYELSRHDDTNEYDDDIVDADHDVVIDFFRRWRRLRRRGRLLCRMSCPVVVAEQTLLFSMLLELWG